MPFPVLLPSRRRTARAVLLAAWSAGPAAAPLVAMATGRPAATAAPTTAAPTAAAAPATGTFVVRSVNGRALPFADRFSTTGGYEHRVYVERFLVRLDRDGRFVLTTLGAYKDAPRAMPVGANGGAGQLRDATVRGRWVRSGAAITLLPDPSRKGREYAPATGRLTADGLTLEYEVRWAYGGRFGARRYVLRAQHDPSFL